MKEMTGESYESSPYSKALVVAGAKDGKTTWLIGQALGVWPACKLGGVVSEPKNLHLITTDVAALKGVVSFLTKHCNAPASAMKFTVYNMEDDARRVAASAQDWDYTFYNGLLQAITTYHERAARGGTHMMIISSLTGVGQALQRGIFGKPGLGDKKGSGGDRAKWPAFSSQIAEVRSLAQMDPGHCFWEGHLDKKSTGASGAEEVEQDSINVQGSGGKNFAYNVGEVFRLRRNVGMKYKTAPTVDQVYLDTQPSLTFMNNGRGFSELEPKEWDLAGTLAKLKYKVGGWKAAAGSKT
jgi:hypothetical protein